MAQALSVLIVDDSIDVLQTLSDILGVAGYAVRTAPSAERALQILESAPIDLVITDLRMGGMGGMSLIRRLRESRPEIPVIALSGFADAATVAQAFREGAVDFLTKPFTAGEVLEAVSRALAPRRNPGIPPSPPSASPAALPSAQRVQAEEILRGLQGRLGAELVVLVGAGGELLAAQGFMSEAVARVVAQGIARMGALQEPLAAALGEPAFIAQTWEGEQRVLYVIRLAGSGFLAALVPRALKPGMAWLELREARAQLEAICGEPPAPIASAPSGSELAAPERAGELFFPGEEAGSAVVSEGELLSYEEARARGLIPDLGEELEAEG